MKGRNTSATRPSTKKMTTNKIPGILECRSNRMIEREVSHHGDS